MALAIAISITFTVFNGVATSSGKLEIVYQVIGLILYADIPYPLMVDEFPGL